ncbi:MAG: heavy-metal-associated domain-containing protein [Bacteroidetes bacterium]|nr:heavy-metal-associated domain-containing protein [Bacteroidota bacterium]
MTHTYSITGMHCGSCAARVQKAVETLEDVERADVTQDPPRATITMRRHIDTERLNEALSTAGAYRLTEEGSHSAVHQAPATMPINIDFPQAETPAGLRAYYPLGLVLGYIIGIVLLQQVVRGYSAERLMSDFMGGFFLSFSFFKLLDLRGFAASYSSYDIITKRWLGFGYIYPFIELGFGIGFLFFPQTLWLYSASLAVMSVSIVGVIESVTNKRTIKCACLGTVFNLPMGTITILEDGLMIVMSVAMIAMRLL